MMPLRKSMVRSKLLAVWTDRDLPKLAFSGEVHKGQECHCTVWKIKSEPAAWLAELRDEIRELAERLNFKVEGLIDHSNEVHLTIRGRWNKSGKVPAHPADRSSFQMTFDKLGFRRRFELGTGPPEPFGAVLAVSFGLSAYVKSMGSMCDGEWPPMQGRPRLSSHTRKPDAIDAHPHAGTMSTKPPVLWLFKGTKTPLELGSDVEVGKAAGVHVADLAATPNNAQVCWGVAQTLCFSERLVLLKVSRSPTVYFNELGKCAELEQCRADLRAAGKRLQLPCGAWAFVHAEKYDAALKAVELRGGLSPQFVLVSPDYEACVMMVIQRIPCNSKVRVQWQSTVPMGLASEVADSGISLHVKKTFLNIDIPSSLRPSTCGQGCTASTTQAHQGQNPRCA